MALIACPECGKQISETTPSCPHCGYQLSTQTATRSTSVPAPTEIGALKKRVASGIVEILLGLLIAVISIPLIGLFGLGIFGILFGLFIFFSGTLGIAGTHNVTCPYCGRASHITRTAANFKCPACKKRSVRKEDHLDPIP